MRPLPWILALAIIVITAGSLDYLGYRSLQELRADMRHLQGQVNDIDKLTQQESAAAAAAGKNALEAAARAEVAAQGRQQAETLKQQAESGRDQAVAAAQQSQLQAKQAQEQVDEMHREREEELNHMQEALNKVVETRRTPNGMVIVLPNSIFRFEFDSADLNQHNRELLSRIAGILLVSKGFGLSVYGYTDDVGTTEYNQQLSLRRAKAVEEFLVHSGIDQAIINTKGFGKSSPLVQGTSTENRAQNRRVEIALTESSIHFTGLAQP
jgi:outer membrane protein OmpA-like peptidoglycan-associated protein